LIEELKMLKRTLHKLRFNQMSYKLDSDRTATRRRNFPVKQETAMNQRIAQKIIDFLELSSEDKVLDIGCSEGFFSREFKNKSQYVCGIDFSPGMIKVAKKKGEGIANLSFKVATILDLPFKNEEFSKINCFSVIQYLDNFKQVQKAFHEISRVLVAGGKAFVGGNYFSKNEVLHVISNHEATNSPVLAKLSYLKNLFIFNFFPPILFFSKENLFLLGRNSGLKVVFIRKTIDEPYEAIGMDALFQKM
jgi:ubiquinone/menaquinone biosynthesis C-methylase UbiE